LYVCEQDDWELPDFLHEPRRLELFLGDMVGRAEYIEPIWGDFSDDSYRKSRAWERMPADDVFG
jgi:hypothetical protein